MLRNRPQLKVEHCGVTWVERGLIQLGETKTVFLAVGTGDLRGEKELSVDLM